MRWAGRLLGAGRFGFGFGFTRTMSANDSTHAATIRQSTPVLFVATAPRFMCRCRHLLSPAQLDGLVKQSLTDDVKLCMPHLIAAFHSGLGVITLINKG